MVVICRYAALCALLSITDVSAQFVAGLHQSVLPPRPSSSSLNTARCPPNSTLGRAKAILTYLEAGRAVQKTATNEKQLEWFWLCKHMAYFYASARRKDEKESGGWKGGIGLSVAYTVYVWKMALSEAIWGFCYVSVICFISLLLVY